MDGRERGLRVVAPIQVRMASTRLPGKAMLPLGGVPMIEALARRLGQSKRLDEVLIATTENPEDDVLEKLAETLGVRVYRGSAADVLKRLVNAAEYADGDIVLEATGDNPLVDGELADRAIDLYLGGGFGYVNTNLRGAFPLGYQCGVFSADDLRRALAETPPSSPFREHPNLYFHRNPELFPHGWLEAPPRLNRPEIRLTVDYPEDYDVICAIYEALASSDAFFRLEDAIRFLDEHPELIALNRDMRQFTP